MVGVESSKVASLESLSQFGGQILEQRGILHLFVRDARQGHHIWRYGLTRVHIEVVAFFFAVHIYLNIRNLYDSVFYKIKPRRLQIEDYQGLC